MPVVSRRCNGKACNAQMPVKKIATDAGNVLLALCPKCDALKCDACGNYSMNYRLQKCPDCGTRYGFNPKKGK